MYRDSIALDGAGGNAGDRISIDATGFGLVGLCISARLGYTTRSSAAAQVRETLNTFETHVWPICVQHNFCPHFVDLSGGTLVNVAEYASITSALFISSAHYAVECLQPDVGASAAAQVRRFLTQTRWVGALPSSCDSCGLYREWPRVGAPPLLPWNEYDLVGRLGAAAEVLGGNLSTVGLGTTCTPQVHFHRCWVSRQFQHRDHALPPSLLTARRSSADAQRPDAYGVGLASAPSSTFGGATVLSDVANTAQPDFHMSYLAILTDDYGPGGVAEQHLTRGQARASQHYWARVLGMLNAGGTPFDWPWLANATITQKQATATRLAGLVGVSAGLQPSSTWSSASPTASTYYASGMELSMDTVAGALSGGRNPYYVYHLPSAYTFVHLQRLRIRLLAQHLMRAACTLPGAVYLLPRLFVVVGAGTS
jgi:hypothetical protein